jgi:K+-sensing histidine kinase KdpD
VTSSLEVPSGAAIATADDAVILFDQRGRVIFADDGATALLDGRLETVDDLADHLESPDGARLTLGGTPRHVEARLRDVRGSTWVDVTVYPVPADLGGAEPHSIVVIRDVTARRRTRELREAFASVVSHELRTPVTTIYGGAQLLADASISDRTRIDASRAVAQEAERLYRLVEDLLVLARFDQPLAMADEPVLLQRFLPALAAGEGDRGDVAVRLDMADDLPAVSGRQGYIEQVVRHLILSAVRFSSPSEPVTMRVRRTDGNVEVLLHDSGPAIDATEAAELFELFHRSARTVSGASGANLGLFVCHRLVEAMGGRIWARPGTSGGAEMGFSLRVAEGQD